MPEIEALGAMVCGVSADGDDRPKRFALKYRLQFPLLSDGGGAVAARYGSLLHLGFLKLARRNTFLIDPQGRIAKIYRSANPSRNPQEVITDLRQLGKA